VVPTEKPKNGLLESWEGLVSVVHTIELGRGHSSMAFVRCVSFAFGSAVRFYVAHWIEVGC
jgi:hypothetical protein